MTINARIREARQKLGLSQAAFAERLNVKQPSINWIEKDGSNVSDRYVRQISQEFGVNEQWIKSGEGEMLLNDGEQLTAQLQARFKLTKTDEEFLRGYLTAAPSERKKIFEAWTTIGKWLNK